MRKSYGGKVGVWLRKKRKRLNLPSNLAVSSISLPRDVNRIDSLSDGLKSHPIKNIVGWVSNIVFHINNLLLW